MVPFLPRLDTLLDALAGWPRRLAAGLCIAFAALSAIRTGSSAGSARLVSIVVLSRSVPAGAALTAADLQLARWPAGAVPSDRISSISAAANRHVVAAMARGAPVSSAALLEPAVAAALAAGRVATTVQLGNAEQAAILRAGVLIDLYAGIDNGVMVEGKTASGQAADRALAENVEVLAVLPAATGAAGDQTLNLVIATDPGTAARLAAHLSSPFLATLVRPP